MMMFSSPAPQPLHAASDVPAQERFPRRIAVISSRHAIHRQSAWLILLAEHGLEELTLCGPEVEPSVGGAGEGGATVRALAAAAPYHRQMIARIREGRPDAVVVVGDATDAGVYRDVCPLVLRLELGADEQRGRFEVPARGVVVRCRLFDARQPTVAIDEATAPIYPHDARGDVESRAWELGVRMLVEGLGGGPVGRPPGGPNSAEPAVPEERTTALRSTRGANPLWAKPVRVRRLVKSVAYWLLMALWRPLRDLVRTVLRRHPVRIFAFHRISDLCRDGMTVSPAVFARQLAYIARHHELVDVSRALTLTTGHRRLGHPVAALTFDDGYRSVYEFARPMLRGRGVPACCFLTTDLVGTSARFEHDQTSPVVRFLDVMTWQEVRALEDDGWEIGGHSASHRRLSDCDGATLLEELTRPRDAVRRELGRECTTMAYPFGGRDDMTEEALMLAREVGYTSCCSGFGGENEPPTEPYHVRRIELGGDHETLAWQARAHGIDLGGWRGIGRARRSGGAAGRRS